MLISRMKNVKLKNLIIFLGIINVTLYSQAGPGEFTCATLKKDDGTSVVQQWFTDNCSVNRPFSMGTNKEGAPTVCCIGKQQ